MNIKRDYAQCKHCPLTPHNQFYVKSASLFMDACLHLLMIAHMEPFEDRPIGATR